jgi:hypothetical protein
MYHLTESYDLTCRYKNLANQMLQFLLNATNQNMVILFFYSIIHIVARDKGRVKMVVSGGLRTSNKPPDPDSAPLYLVKLLYNK